MELSRRGRWTTGTRSEALFITAENEPSDMNRSLLLIMCHRSSRHSSWLSRWRPGNGTLANSKPSTLPIPAICDVRNEHANVARIHVASVCREPSKEFGKSVANAVAATRNNVRSFYTRYVKRSEEFTRRGR